MGAHHSTISSSEPTDDDYPMDQQAVLSQYKVAHRLFPGSGRMMKTYQLSHKTTEATAVVKAMWVAVSRELLQEQQEELKRIKQALREEPHVAPFTFWCHQTEFNTPLVQRQRQPVYLARPHVYTTLSDRLASRPFFTSIEKLWICHQLLQALEAMHQHKVCHGFLTTENVGLTSWNWVVLLDISSYKAHTTLPDDDPSEYLYYFQDHHHQHSSDEQTQTSSDATTEGGAKKVSRNREKRCYIAPERFVSSRVANNSETPPQTMATTTSSTTQPFSKYNQLTPAMDIFSAGCVVMELWLNGERALDLGDLMQYRRQSTLVPQLQEKLNRIESSALRAACKHMVQVDPSQRLTAKAYLERLQASEALPQVMEDCLEPLLKRVSDPNQVEILTPDARLALAAVHYENVLWETLGVRDPEGAEYLETVLGSTFIELERGVEDATNTSTTATSEASTPPVLQPTSTVPTTISTADLFAETESLLKKLDSLAMMDDATVETQVSHSTGGAEPTTSSEQDAKAAEPLTAKRSALCKSSLLIYLQLVLASIRHVQRPTSKLVALEMLTRLCDLCDSDEIRLQRMVPVSVSLLQDQDTLVRAGALKFLAHVVSKVQSFPPSDSKIFPQYIFKRVSPLLTDPSLVVRLAFCQSIAVLAETAQRFLDISHAVQMYEAIGAGGTSSSVGTGASAADDTSKSQGSKAKKKVTPTGTNVFGDDVAKLLGDDTKKEDSKSKESPSKGESGFHGGGNLVSSPSGKTLIASNYQEELAALQETVSRWVVHITTDPSEHSSPTKRALLNSNLSCLCAFFGLEGVMAFILPQILAFLNDRKDAQLRMDLFCHLPSVCRIVGRGATEHFVLPCLESGLADGDEQVVGAAVRCLAELVELGLLSRSVLLGKLKVAPGANSTVELSSDGLLRKYGSLLVHPSAQIRYGAISTVNASCLALGSPDSEVYVAHILHPYLRFQPSLRHLQTRDGMEACLYPSWSRVRFNDELSAFVKSSSQQPVGPWTSIGISKSDFGAKSKASSAGPAAGEASTQQPERMSVADVMEAQTMRVREYLHVLGRRITQSSNTKQDSDEESGDAYALRHGIEGSLKLAQNIKFPRQDTIGGNTRTLPAWYSSLRDHLQTMDTKTTETSAIRSVSALGEIYGLSIMAASDNAGEPTNASGDEGKLSEKEMQDMANSRESKVIEAVCRGEWGSETHLDPVLLDTSLLITKLKALGVPPLPPRLGELTAARTLAPPVAAPRTHGKDTNINSSEWRPKADTLLATSSPVTGHTAPVVRLAVSLDQSFFVSGSYDGSCRVWELDQIETSSGVLDSSVTYTGHADGQAQNSTRINDVAMVEGSHSVVSAASNGSVHCWRVDVVAQKRIPAPANSDLRGPRSRAVGTSEVRQINPNEGEILAVSHFNSPSASVVTFATQKGVVHSWDLRSCVEPFQLKHGPDIGYLTSMALGTDRNWILTGTSRGFLALWDLRFNQTVKLWHHSRAAPITRLATSFVPPPQMWGSRNLDASSVRPYVFASCGPNECGMFDVSTGNCNQVFRTVGYGSAMASYAEEIPKLHEVPISAASTRRSALMTNGFLKNNNAMTPSPVTSINAMCGSIGVSDHSYLMTGGGDARIRFWDFAVPSKCFVISGHSSVQPRPSFERIDLDGPCRLMLCRQLPSTGKMGGPSKFTKKLGKVLSKPENHHTEAIQDLKIVNKAVISASRDCTVKVWR